MQTVVELPAFSKTANGLFGSEELAGIIETMAHNPLIGDEIPGTGGVRKVRFAAQGKGKRGGARIIYFYFDESAPLYLLSCYAKGSVSDITSDEKKAMRGFATAIKAQLRGSRTS